MIEIAARLEYGGEGRQGLGESVVIAAVVMGAQKKSMSIDDDDSGQRSRTGIEGEMDIDDSGQEIQRLRYSHFY